MGNEPSKFVPEPPLSYERFDRYVSSNLDDEKELKRVRRQVVQARRHSVDPMTIDDAVERTEQVIFHSEMYMLGDAVNRLTRTRSLKLHRWHRRRRHYPEFAPLGYATTLTEHYQRWLTLEARYRHSIHAPRGVASTVATVIIGADDLDATRYSIEAQFVPGDEIIQCASVLELASTLAGLRRRSDGPQWVCVLNAGDVLAPYAFAAMVAAADDSTSVLYADQDVIDAWGNRVNPWLKPDDHGVISALGCDVFGEALLARVRDLPEISSDAATGALYDALLRLDEVVGSFRHVPTVALTRPAGRPGYLLDGDLAACVASALQRRGWSDSARPSHHPGVVTWEPFAPPAWPHVHIVIPTRDRLDLLQRCVMTIDDITRYENYSITIVDNGSVEPATLDWLASSRHQVVRDDSTFHFPALVNLGARGSAAEFILLLNNDMEIIDPDWLEQLVRVAGLPSVGIVGALLTDREGHLAHSGVAVPGEPVQVSFPATSAADDRTLHATHESLAVLGACQLVHRELWLQLNGHDEYFQIECSDVDFSLRARELGYRTVVAGNVRLRHLGKMSRGESSHDDVDLFFYRWGVGDGFIDPHYTPLVEFSPGPAFRRLPGR